MYLIKNVIKFGVVIVSTVCITMPASGQMTPRSPQPEMSLDPTAAEAGRYTLDEDHQSLLVRVQHKQAGFTVMRFNVVTGSLDWDPIDVTKSQLSINVETASLDSPVQWTFAGRDTFAEFIAGPRWLDADSHPEATFVSTSITKQDDTHGTIEGMLTLRGVSLPVAIDAEFLAAGIGSSYGVPTLAFTGSAVMDRTAFGITTMPAEYVGFEVELRMDVEFLKFE